jgi:hypothetical protein
MKQDDEIAAAKAKLLKVAGDFDPLNLVRAHPLAAVAVAAATGAAMGSDPECVANTTKLMRLVLEMIQPILRERPGGATGPG